MTLPADYQIDIAPKYPPVALALGDLNTVYQLVFHRKDYNKKSAEILGYGLCILELAGVKLIRSEDEAQGLDVPLVGIGVTWNIGPTPPEEEVGNSMSLPPLTPAEGEENREYEQVLKVLLYFLPPEAIYVYIEISDIPDEIKAKFYTHPLLLDALKQSDLYQKLDPTADSFFNDLKIIASQSPTLAVRLRVEQQKAAQQEGLDAIAEKREYAIDTQLAKWFESMSRAAIPPACRVGFIHFAHQQLLQVAPENRAAIAQQIEIIITATEFFPRVLSKKIQAQLEQIFSAGPIDQSKVDPNLAYLNDRMFAYCVAQLENIQPDRRITNEKTRRIIYGLHLSQFEARYAGRCPRLQENIQAKRAAAPTAEAIIDQDADGAVPQTATLLPVKPIRFAGRRIDPSIGLDLKYLDTDVPCCALHHFKDAEVDRYALADNLSKNPFVIRCKDGQFRWDRERLVFTQWDGVEVPLYRSPLHKTAGQTLQDFETVFAIIAQFVELTPAMMEYLKIGLCDRSGFGRLPEYVGKNMLAGARSEAKEQGRLDEVQTEAKEQGRLGEVQTLVEGATQKVEQAFEVCTVEMLSPKKLEFARGPGNQFVYQAYAASDDHLANVQLRPLRASLDFPFQDPQLLKLCAQHVIRKAYENDKLTPADVLVVVLVLESEFKLAGVQSIEGRLSPLVRQLNQLMADERTEEDEIQANPTSSAQARLRKTILEAATPSLLEGLQLPKQIQGEMQLVSAEIEYLPLCKLRKEILKAIQFALQKDLSYKESQTIFEILKDLRNPEINFKKLFSQLRACPKIFGNLMEVPEGKNGPCLMDYPFLLKHWAQEIIKKIVREDDFSRQDIAIILAEIVKVKEQMVEEGARLLNIEEEKIFAAIEELLNILDLPSDEEAHVQQIKQEVIKIILETYVLENKANDPQQALTKNDLDAIIIAFKNTLRRTGLQNADKRAIPFIHRIEELMRLGDQTHLKAFLLNEIKPLMNQTPTQLKEDLLNIESLKLRTQKLLALAVEGAQQDILKNAALRALNNGMKRLASVDMQAREAVYNTLDALENKAFDVEVVVGQIKHWPQVALESFVKRFTRDLSLVGQHPVSSVGHFLNGGQVVALVQSITNETTQATRAAAILEASTVSHTRFPDAFRNMGKEPGFFKTLGNWLKAQLGSGPDYAGVLDAQNLADLVKLSPGKLSEVLSVKAHREILVAQKNYTALKGFCQDPQWQKIQATYPEIGALGLGIAREVPAVAPLAAAPAPPLPVEIVIPAPEILAASEASRSEEIKKWISQVDALISATAAASKTDFSREALGAWQERFYKLFSDPTFVSSEKYAGKREIAQKQIEALRAEAIKAGKIKADIEQHQTSRESVLQAAAPQTPSFWQPPDVPVLGALPPAFEALGATVDAPQAIPVCT